MQYLKFNGFLKEITEQYPNIDICEFLQNKLQLPSDKAGILAARMEKEYCRKVPNKTERAVTRTILEKPDKPELTPKPSVYCVESLSDNEFRHFIKWLFDELGYEVHEEKSTSSGIDFLALKNCEKTVVVARKYLESCKVTNSIVLVAEEAKRFYECKRSIILATAYFNEQAMVDAQRLGLELWDKETLDRQIAEIKNNFDSEKKICFPQFKESLVKSLLLLGEMENFTLEPRVNNKYDLYLSGGKFPLLTFQARDNTVVRCVFRIKDNAPVREFDGVTLIGKDQNNERFGPDDMNAYESIVKYLQVFL